MELVGTLHAWTPAQAIKGLRGQVSSPQPPWSAGLLGLLAGSFVLTGQWNGLRLSLQRIPLHSSVEFIYLADPLLYYGVHLSCDTVTKRQLIALLWCLCNLFVTGDLAALHAKSRH